MRNINFIWIEPTIVENVPPTCDLSCKEAFGFVHYLLTIQEHVNINKFFSKRKSVLIYFFITQHFFAITDQSAQLRDTTTSKKCVRESIIHLMDYKLAFFPRTSTKFSMLINTLKWYDNFEIVCDKMQKL
jgi:hypothetical protein